MIPRVSGRKVLLVGWDGADWQIIQPLLDRGELPALESIINRGVMGDLSSLRPMLSPMLWTSIATGKRPSEHGVHGFVEVDHELNQVVPVSSKSRRCKAIWNMLNDAGLKTHAVSWFASHPAEPLGGACVTERYSHPVPVELDDEWKLSPGTVHPDRLAEPLAKLRIRPEEVPGEVLNMFVQDADKVNQTHDKRLHQLAVHLAEAFTAHAAVTYLLEHEPWDFATVYYHTVDLICHDFMRYHPPALPGTFDQDFAKYSDVVNSTYRLHDAMLGRLLNLAGRDTTVILVSDHGFKSDRRRPLAVPNIPAAITIWHRFNGIFAMCGEGVKQDELIYGANLLDITPTILSLFGLPVGADMDGRVLREAFITPPEVEHIESWEKIDSEAKPAPLPVKKVPTEERALVRQFIDLGYVAESADDPKEALRSTERENRWFLAQSCVAAGRDLDALPLLETVYEEWPERFDFASELGLCQMRLGLIEDARETLAPLTRNRQAGATALLLAAQLEYHSRNFEAGLNLLERAEALDPKHSALQQELGKIRLRLGRLDLAETAFRKAIDYDPEQPYSYSGVAACRIRKRDWEGAADYALRAVAIKFDQPLAHYTLGVALARLGQDAQAAQALETCLRYAPGFYPAHRYLLALYRRQPERAENVRIHREFIRGHVQRRKSTRTFHRRLRREALARAKVRAEERARARKQARDLALAQDQPTIEPTEFLIVSGLPRSGTSLMMNMLQAAGVPLMTDEKRRADESNPRGYFEWEAIKTLPHNPYVIEQAAGRAVKVISMLLPSLPTKHTYRVIFMQREIEEVGASQRTLRERIAGTRASDSSKMTASLAQHRDRMLQMLQQTPNVQLLEVNFTDLVEHPRAQAERIAAFAKIGHDKIENMVAVVDPTLRHFAGALVDQVSAGS